MKKLFAVMMLVVLVSACTENPVANDEIEQDPNTYSLLN